MFNALMKVQWKWTRAAVLLATVIGFIIPVASVRITYAGGVPGAQGVVRVMQQVGVMYAVLAAAAGLIVAVFAWSADHKGRHVYALSLPISRARYAAMRYGSGILFLLVPAAGVLIGCIAALALARVPEGLHAYPVALTMRYLLASVVAFSIFFAIAAGTQRAAAIVLGSIAGIFVVALLISAMDVRFDLLGWISKAVFESPGLLSIFTGRWTLIDV